MGEERILKKVEEPFDYSVKARTKIKAYSITKIDANKKLPKEIMQSLVKMVEQRYKWIEDRARSLIKASVAVAKMDPSKEKYDEIFAKLTKKYPAAMPNALTSMRKKQIALKSYLTPHLSISEKDTDSLFSSQKKLPSIENSLDISNVLMTELPRVAPASTKENKSLLTLRAKPFIQEKKYKKNKMPNATSVSGVFSGFPLIPILNKNVAKKYIQNMFDVSKSVKFHDRNNGSLFEKFPNELDTIEMKQFIVGTKAIRIVNNRNRQTTPNPFNSLPEYKPNTQV